MGTLLARRRQKIEVCTEYRYFGVYVFQYGNQSTWYFQRALARTAGEDLGDGQSLSDRIIAVAGPVTWIAMEYSQA